MKKSTIVIILVLCIVIVGLSMNNNTLFTKEKQHQDTLEARRDSLLDKQIESQDSLILETNILYSISHECKNSILIIQEDLQQSKNNSDRILKIQKQILRKIK